MVTEQNTEYKNGPTHIKLLDIQQNLSLSYSGIMNGVQLRDIQIRIVYLNPLTHTLHKQINSTWTANPNVKSKVITLSTENISATLE
jgi:hypothetical protein